MRARRLLLGRHLQPGQRPHQLAFRPALPGNYHGEGAHVITFPDGRDILAVNNEFCTPGDTIPQAGGGFALYDVTNPAEPDVARRRGRRLRARVGDLVCCNPDAAGAEDPIAHEYHSVFMWQDDGRVYLIGVDNCGAGADRRRHLRHHEPEPARRRP